MRFITKFSVGAMVQRQTGRGASDPRFIVGQVRITTRKDRKGSVIEYRTNYSTGRNGPWYAEEILRLVH